VTTASAIPVALCSSGLNRTSSKPAAIEVALHSSARARDSSGDVATCDISKFARFDNRIAFRCRADEGTAHNSAPSRCADGAIARPSQRTPASAVPIVRRRRVCISDPVSRVSSSDLEPTGAIRARKEAEEYEPHWARPKC